MNKKPITASVDRTGRRGTYTIKDRGLSVDVYAAYGAGSATSGRIKQLSFNSDRMQLTLCHSQSEPERRFVLRAQDLDCYAQLRRGDIIALEGLRPKKRTIDRIVLLNRSANFPECDGWSDEDAALHRELDVVLNPSSMRTILNRNRIVYGIRHYMQQCGFCEIELPILKKYPDIAPAPHFEIANPSGFERLYLRTTFPAFERLLVGFERAYSLGSNFRNGDFSYKNLPEFQMFCMGAALRDYRWAAQLLQHMFAELAQEVNGTTKIQLGGKEYDLATWDHVCLLDAFRGILGCGAEQLDTDEALVRLCEVNKVVIPPFNRRLKGHMLRAVLLDAIFEQRIVPEFSRPTFFCEVPWYLAGPAEPVPNQSFLKMRGEGYVGGVELMNAKCVLTSARKTRQWHSSITSAKRRLGFEHLARKDTDFLKSIRFGLMPGSLASFGVDRLVMMILGKTTITEVTTYPLTKPKA